MSEEEARKKLIEAIKNKTISGYGYDVYLPKLFTTEFPSKDPQNPYSLEEAEKQSPILYDIVWKLCLEGILRPGIKRFGEQSTTDGSAGNGFSVTSYGRQQLFKDE